MAAIERFYQLSFRNPNTPKGDGLRFMFDSSRRIFRDRIKYNEGTGLSVIIDTPLTQLLGRKNRNSLSGFLGDQLVSCPTGKINDILKEIFTGRGTKVLGLVEVENSTIAKNCLLSGNYLSDAAASFIRRSKIGAGVSIMACGITDSTILGNKGFDGENNPFSILQASMLAQATLTGRFEMIGTRISNLTLRNLTAGVKLLDSENLSAAELMTGKVVFDAVEEDAALTV